MKRVSGKIRLIVMAPLSLFLLAAQTDAPLDIGFVTGMSTGVLTDPKRDDQISLGGVPLSIRLTMDQTRRWSFVYQAGILLDIVNSQVVRQSYEGGISYHLMGGSRKIQRNTSLATIRGKSTSDLSLALRASFSKFSASLVDNPDDKITGSILEIKPGISYRIDIWWDSAIEIEGMIAAIGFPSTVDRITHSGMDLNLAWRKHF